jgi:hypothetical protein
MSRRTDFVRLRDTSSRFTGCATIRKSCFGGPRAESVQLNDLTVKDILTTTNGFGTCMVRPVVGTTNQFV